MPHIQSTFIDFTRPSGEGIEMCLQRFLVVLKVKKVDQEQGKIHTQASNHILCIPDMQ